MLSLTQFFKGLLVLSAMFFLISAGILCLHVASAVDQTALSVRQSLTQVTKDADDIKVMVNATLYQGEETLHEVSDMARTEKAAQKSQLAQVNKVLDQLTLTVQHVDASQAQMSASVVATLQSVQPVMIQTRDTLAQVQVTVKGMDAVIQDPNIPETLAHVNATMSNLQSTTQSVDAYVKRITTPRGFVSTLWHGLLSLITPGAEVAVAIK